MAHNQGYRSRSGFGPSPKVSDPMRTTAYATVVSSASATGGALGAIITAGNAQNYNVSTNKVLVLHICHNGTADSADRIYRTIEIANVGASAANAAAATSAELVTAINAHVFASKFVTASVSSNALRLTTKIKGTLSRIFVTGSANTPLGFTQVADATSAAGAAGVQGEAVIRVLDLAGNFVDNADVTCTLYAAATGATKDTTATIQHIFTSKGAAKATNGTNQVTMVTDRYGYVSFGVIDSGAGAQDTYLDVVVDQSQKGLAARTAITTGSE